ncbi:MAG: phosphodiester glycosidase family protein [Candidatus Aminicenantia bacterium]
MKKLIFHSFKVFKKFPYLLIKKKIKNFLISLLTFSILIALAFPYDFKEWLKNQNPFQWQYENIHPFVYYKKLRIHEIPLSIHILKVYSNPQFIKIDLQKAENGVYGRKTLREIIENEIKRGRRVIAGINASFFKEDGKPEGLFVDEGKIYTLNNRRSSLVMTKNGKLFISKTLIEIYFLYEKEKLKINALNNDNSNHNLTLFTHLYNKKIKILGNHKGIVVKIKGKRFSPTEKIEGVASELLENGEKNLKENEVMLLIDWNMENLRKIKKNPSITFIIKNLYFRDDIDFAVTGAPQIVRKGVNVYKGTTEGLTSKFVDVRHPRTGIGISKNGKMIFMVVVDGRQPNLSIGMTLDEFAELFIKLGCYNALNLDGGGSSTMWVKGEVVNSPSDPTGERPVSDGLLVLEKELKR